MKTMTVEQLYEKLCSKAFQDPRNGDLHYNYFMFQYDATKEYDMLRQIDDIREKIRRPNNNVDILLLNLFEEFTAFLDARSFGRKWNSYKDYLIHKEQTMHNEVQKSLGDLANSDEFIDYLHKRIMKHVEKVDDNMIRPYVFVYGVGAMFPYLRVNNLLVRYEAPNNSSAYKLIIFYPGEQYENTYKLFGKLEDYHTYRASLLLNE